MAAPFLCVPLAVDIYSRRLATGIEPGFAPGIEIPCTQANGKNSAMATGTTGEKHFFIFASRLQLVLESCVTSIE